MLATPPGHLCVQRIDFRLMLSKKCKEELEKGIVHNK